MSRFVFLAIAPSPAILRRVIQHHLHRYKEIHTHVAQLLQNTLYVDDLPDGATDDKNRFQFHQQNL